MKTYLGDGVYAEIQHGQVVLTVEDGISTNSRIYLEPEVYTNLVRFVEDAERRRVAGGVGEVRNG